MVTAVVGLNWGDEGKGRMVDYLAKETRCVVRYQGGDNAGHTVINQLGRFTLHNFPSGICYPEVMNVIASGSVLNPVSFLQELEEVRGKGLPVDNLAVSERCTLILPHALVLERLEENRLKDKGYGSTMSGIAPTYGLKYLKKGIQAGELLYPDYLREHLRAVISYANLLIESYGEPGLDPDSIYEDLIKQGEVLKPFLRDTGTLVENFLLKGEPVLVEAQLGALRDITHGIYPYTTSSSTLGGYSCASIPISPREIRSVVGITKAYSTCVGEGPFVTELFGNEAHDIRQKGKEYGAKTGRPRRIGHFDAVATRYGCRLQQATDMAVTCLDVLEGRENLKICIGYRVGNTVIRDFPLQCVLEQASPVYETLPGFPEGLSQASCLSDLPDNALRYLGRIRALCGVPITYVSVGPERNALIRCNREDIRPQE